MKSSPFLLRGTVLCALAVPGLPQSVADMRVARPVLNSTPRLDLDTLADGTIWVRGETYKARFDARGARYIPFLGSDAPQNHPVDFHVQRVSVGGVELDFDAAAAAVVEDQAIAFDRGAFIERYLLRPAGIEQTFVFDELPRRGEIEITIGVESSMASASDAEGFLFANERGHVRYGRAFVFESGGEKVPIDAQLDGSLIRLCVPAARVGSAQLPLTIDPVISTYNMTNGGPSQFAADTAYDASNAVYLTVMEEIFSASDHDVRAVRHTEAGAGLNIRFIDTSDANWTGPCVANNNENDQFLVVAAVGAAPSRQIWTRHVTADAALAISAPIHVSTFLPAVDCYRPDVGGDQVDEPDTRYFATWESNLGAGVLSVSTVVLGAPNPTQTGIATYTFEGVATNPSVSKSCGTGPASERAWSMAFESESAPGDRDVRWVRVGNDGWFDHSGALTIPGSDDRYPSVTATLDGSDRWMIGYQRNVGASDWDLVTQLMQAGAMHSSILLSAQSQNPDLDQVDPVCDTDGRQFLIAYTERATPFYTLSDIKLTSLVAVDTLLRINEGEVSVAPGLELDARPNLATRGSGGSISDNALVVFDRDLPGGDDIFATAYDLPDGGPVVPYCFGDGSGSDCPCFNNGATGHGCANSSNGAGALLESTGVAALGFDDSLSLQASGMPGSTTCLFFQGTFSSGGGLGTTFGDGLRCASGTVIRLATKTASGGAASYPGVGDPDISDRGLVPAAGGTRTYQVRYRNNTSYCTPDTFNTTNGVRVSWLP